MSDKFKKAVDFEDARVQADELQSETVENPDIRRLVVDALADKEQGDLVKIGLPDNKVLHMEIIEPGLYSGHTKHGETGNILFEFQRQTLEQVLDNIIIRDPKLSLPEEKEEVEIEPKQVEVEKEAKQINITINIQKAIDRYMNLVKGVRAKDYVSLKPKKTEEDKKIEKEQENESLKSKGNKMDKEKVKKSVEKAFDNLPEWVDTEEDMIKAHKCLKDLKEELGESEGQKAFEMICKSKYAKSEDELIAKSAEQMFNDSNDILDFDDDSHIITEQQKIVHDCIQSQLKKESKEESEE